MAIKRYSCRTHGGIFSKQAARGRPPVRCAPEFPCTKAEDVPADHLHMEVTASGAAKIQNKLRNVPGVGKVAVITTTDNFDSMSNAELKAYAREHYSTIGKVTSREQLIRALRAQEAKQPSNREAQLAKSITRPPESNAEAPAATNDSLPLAKRAKEQLEAVGWVVKGRAWIDASDEESNGMWAEVTASRDAETLIMKWHGGCIVEQNYAFQHLKPSENALPGKALDFDPDELSDKELVHIISGMKVTWWNTLASSAETATISGNRVSIEHIFSSRGDEDNGKRIVKFVDHGGGGFRAFHVDALMKVG